MTTYAKVVSNVVYSSKHDMFHYIIAPANADEQNRIRSKQGSKTTWKYLLICEICVGNAEVLKPI